MIKGEFKLKSEYKYKHGGAVRWIISHVMRYPLLPVFILIGAAASNYTYSNIQLYIGKAFDVIASAGFELNALMLPVIVIIISAVGEGIAGLLGIQRCLH